MIARGRFSRSTRSEVPSLAPAPTPAASAGPSRGETATQETPEEANEYTPSGAASPDMIETARVEAPSKKGAEVRVETAAAAAAEEAEASRIAAPTTGPKLSAAERARVAVENEPHSPSWNGSTYIDGREHHYCGSDFPCQMEPPCSPSIRDLWEKGVPVTPEGPPPSRSPFIAPARAFFGKKQTWPPEPRYRKPVSVESIRVGNTADTTIVHQPIPVTPSPDRAREKEKERARGGCKTMRGLRKVWGFSTGGKAGPRREVTVARSQENLVMAQRLGDREAAEEVRGRMTASEAAANLAAPACYPVGESTVQTAEVVEEAGSGTQTMRNNEREINTEIAAKKE